MQRDRYIAIAGLFDFTCNLTIREKDQRMLDQFQQTHIFTA